MAPRSGHPRALARWSAGSIPVVFLLLTLQSAFGAQIVPGTGPDAGGALTGIPDPTENLPAEVPHPARGVYDRVQDYWRVDGETLVWEMSQTIRHLRSPLSSQPEFVQPEGTLPVLFWAGSDPALRALDGTLADRLGEVKGAWGNLSLAYSDLPFRYELGAATSVDNYTSELHADETRAAWWTNFTVPANAAPGLYNLTVTLEFEDGTRLTDVQPRAVQVYDVLPQELRVVQISDVHVGDLRSAADGVSGRGCANNRACRGDAEGSVTDPDVNETLAWARYAAAIEEINVLQPDLVILSGDVVGQSTEAEFLESYRLLQRFRVPTLVGAGNHDQFYYGEANLDGQKLHWKYFGPLHFYRDWGDYRFVAVNSYDWQEDTNRYATISEGMISPAQLEWIRNVAWHPSKTLVFFQHHNVFEPENDHGLKGKHAYRDLLTGEDGAFAANPVKVNLAGHTHFDEVVLEDPETGSRNTTWITTTSAGSQARDYQSSKTTEVAVPRHEPGKDGTWAHWGYRPMVLGPDGVRDFGFDWHVPGEGLTGWGDGPISFSTGNVTLVYVGGGQGLTDYTEWHVRLTNMVDIELPFSRDVAFSHGHAPSKTWLARVTRTLPDGTAGHVDHHHPGHGLHHGRFQDLGGSPFDGDATHRYRYNGVLTPGLNAFNLTYGDAPTLTDLAGCVVGELQARSLFDTPDLLAEIPERFTLQLGTDEPWATTVTGSLDAFPRLTLPPGLEEDVPLVVTDADTGHAHPSAIRVDTLPPRVTLERPEVATDRPQARVVRATVTDAGCAAAAPANVEVFVNGHPHPFDLQQGEVVFELPADAVPGDHVLRVLATDALGRQAEDEMAVTVSPAPTADLWPLELTLPNSLPRTVSLAGEVADPNGIQDVTHVRILVQREGDPAPLHDFDVTPQAASGTRAGFRADVPLPAGLAPGRYTITAAPEDALGPGVADTTHLDVVGLTSPFTAEFTSGDRFHLHDADPQGFRVTENALVITAHANATPHVHLPLEGEVTFLLDDGTEVSSVGGAPTPLPAMQAGDQLRLEARVGGAGTPDGDALPPLLLLTDAPALRLLSTSGVSEWLGETAGASWTANLSLHLPSDAEVRVRALTPNAEPTAALHVDGALRGQATEGDAFRLGRLGPGDHALRVNWTFRGIPVDETGRATRNATLLVTGETAGASVATGHFVTTPVEYLDALAPTLRVPELADRITGPLTLAAAATDNSGGHVTITYRLGDEEATGPAGTPVTLHPPAHLEGSLPFQVLARDGAGHVNAHPLRDLSIDTRAPRLTGVEVLNLTPDGRLTSAPITVRARAADPHLQGVTLRLDGGAPLAPARVNGTLHEWVLDALSEGLHGIEVTAEDAGGLTNATNLSFGLNGRPVIRPDAPLGTLDNGIQTVRLAGRVDDVDGGLDLTRVRVTLARADGTDARTMDAQLLPDEAGARYTAAFPLPAGLEPGAYHTTVDALDALGARTATTTPAFTLQGLRMPFTASLDGDGTFTFDADGHSRNTLRLHAEATDAASALLRIPGHAGAIHLTRHDGSETTLPLPADGFAPLGPIPSGQTWSARFHLDPAPAANQTPHLVLTAPHAQLQRTTAESSQALWNATAGELTWRARHDVHLASAANLTLGTLAPPGTRATVSLDGIARGNLTATDPLDLGRLDAGTHTLQLAWAVPNLTEAHAVTTTLTLTSPSTGPITLGLAGSRLGPAPDLTPPSAHPRPTDETATDEEPEDAPEERTETPATQGPPTDTEEPPEEDPAQEEAPPEETEGTPDDAANVEPDAPIDPSGENGTHDEPEAPLEDATPVNDTEEEPEADLEPRAPELPEEPALAEEGTSVSDGDAQPGAESGTPAPGVLSALAALGGLAALRLRRRRA